MVVQIDFGMTTQSMKVWYRNSLFQLRRTNAWSLQTLQLIFLQWEMLAKAEYECFAKYAKAFNRLPKYNDKKNSPKHSKTRRVGRVSVA